MIDIRRRPPASDRSNPSVTIPDSQARALDRRHSLDQQQRAFRGPYPSVQSYRPRPPA